MTNASEGLILRQIQSADCAKHFSLGKADHLPLKTFLQKNALDFHQTEIAKTYVLMNPNSLHNPNRILAYITLMNSQIELNEDQRPLNPAASRYYRVFPAVKIARLAVDKSQQLKGVGRQMLDWGINHVKLSIMPHVGCRFIAVDAKRDSIPFYEKNGFTLLNTQSNNDDEHPLMFIDLHKLD